VIPATPGRSIGFDVPTSGHDFTDDTGYVLDVTVTDATGLASTDSVTIRPGKANVTFNSNVAGVKVSVDSIPHTMPYVMDDVIDFEHAISVPSTTCTGHVRYTFANGSDGRPATHPLTVPAASVTKTATYTGGPQCDDSPPDTTVDYPRTNTLVTAPVTISGTVIDDLSPPRAAAHSGPYNQPVVERSGLDDDGSCDRRAGRQRNPDGDVVLSVQRYAVTASRGFYIDAKGVDAYGNLDLTPDGENFQVQQRGTRGKAAGIFIAIRSCRQRRLGACCLTVELSGRVRRQTCACKFDDALFGPLQRNVIRHRSMTRLCFRPKADARRQCPQKHRPL
jgi:hypothetical protein